VTERLSEAVEKINFSVLFLIQKDLIRLYSYRLLGWLRDELSHIVLLLLIFLWRCLLLLRRSV